MKKIYTAFSLLLVSLMAFSQAPEVGFTSFITGLTAPVDIVNAKDGSNRMFIVQQNGTIRVHSGGSLLATPFLNMSGLITYDAGGERGLLSLVFHPQFSSNGYFFVFYNNTAGNTELAQYHISADANVADASSRKILLTIIKPYTNHNGCKLIFGTDGNLYFGTGDGGSGDDPQNNAQTLSSLLGKMLRINVDNFTTAPYYTIPASNPLVGVAGARGEIYSWGLRNPWRWSFDRQTGDMWIADVGQNAWEEVNTVAAANTSGLNYGWRCFEGTHSYITSLCGATPATGKTYPVFEYAHNSAGGFSITGGYVYRATEFPVLQGYYFCADYVRPNGWLIKSNGAGGWDVTQQTNFPAGVVTFGEAEDGTLYLATLSGTVYKIVPAATLPVRLLNLEARNQNNQDIISWRANTDISLNRFEIEQSDNGLQFKTIGTLSQGSLQANDYRFTTTAPATDRYYRLKMIYRSGTAQYSSVIHLSAKPATGITAVVLSPKQVQVSTPVALQQINVINSQGQQLQKFNNLSAGSHVLNLNMISSGIYYMQCVKQDRSVENIRVIIY